MILVESALPLPETTNVLAGVQAGHVQGRVEHIPHQVGLVLMLVRCLRTEFSSFSLAPSGTLGGGLYASLIDMPSVASESLR